MVFPVGVFDFDRSIVGLAEKLTNIAPKRAWLGVVGLDEGTMGGWVRGAKMTPPISLQISKIGTPAAPSSRAWM